MPVEETYNCNQCWDLIPHPGLCPTCEIEEASLIEYTEQLKEEEEEES